MIPGPDTPGCECLGCQRIRSVKAVICDAVEAMPGADGPGGIYTPWMAVLAIAGARALEMGVPPEVILSAVAQGTVTVGRDPSNLN